MGSSIKLLLTEKHAGRACTYIKKLTNFQNKNSYNFQISKKKKKKKKKKKNQKQRNITTNNTIKNKAKNGRIKQYLQQLISLK